MIITVASGKGGTGKTMVAVNLAAIVASHGQGGPTGGGQAQVSARRDARLLLLDCDVEAPNAHLFLEPAFERQWEVAVPVPQIDLDRCTYCGRCAEACQFNALAVLRQQVLVFADLCHGCGACSLACPEGAIREVPRAIGIVEEGTVSTPSADFDFARGTLEIGQAVAPPIIRQLKHLIHPDQLVIIDAPPGTACPVVESLKGADVALLVTEPTPFGLHDLRLAVEVARSELGLPVGVVINRDGIGDDQVAAYCRSESIPILIRIPFDRRIAEVYSEGGLVVEALPEYRAHFETLYRRLRDEVVT
jgi:MinD superfamily P-loop ATPase